MWPAGWRRHDHVAKACTLGWLALFFFMEDRRSCGPDPSLNSSSPFTSLQLQTTITSGSTDYTYFIDETHQWTISRDIFHRLLDSWTSYICTATLSIFCKRDKLLLANLSYTNKIWLIYWSIKTFLYSYRFCTKSITLNALFNNLLESGLAKQYIFRPPWLHFHIYTWILSN